MRATAPAELIPSGLSSRTMPCTSAGIRRLAFRRARLAGLVDGIDQLSQAHAVLDRGIEGEAQGGRVPNHQRSGQSVAQEAGRALQSALYLFVRALLAEHEVVHPSGAQVAGDIDRRDGDVADALILDVAPQQLRQLALDLGTQP